jgi:hypothetical protein
MIKHWIILGGLVVLISLVNWQWFRPGLPVTHDSQMHVARMANYYLAVKDGHIPVRWAPNLNNGFGYPVFTFNYPLAYILSIPPAVMDVPFETVYKILALVAVMVAAIGMYLLLMALIRHQGAAFSGAWLYATSSYMTTLLYVRGGIGELWFAGLLPLELWVVWNYATYRTRLWLSLTVICTAALFLAHNVLVFFALPLLIGLMIYTITQRRAGWKLIWPLLAGVCLTGFFWWPAVLEQAYTPLSQVSVNRDFINHFPTLGQLWWDVYDYGFSFAGPVDGVPMATGFLLWLGFWPMLLLLLKKQIPKPGLVWLMVGYLAGYLFLMSDASRPVWLLFPWLSFIQFPWRLVIYTTFILSVLAGFGLSRTNRTYLWWLLGVIVFLHTLPRAVPNAVVTNNDEYYLTTAETTSLHDENMPRLFKKHEAYALAEQYFNDIPVYTEHPETRIEITDWKTASHEYVIETELETMVVERTAYFPGWKVHVNDQETPIDNDGKYMGMIAFFVPPGTHRVTTTFTEDTVARYVGNITTLIGAGLWGYLLRAKPKKAKS